MRVQNGARGHAFELPDGLAACDRQLQDVLVLCLTCYTENGSGREGYKEVSASRVLVSSDSVSQPQSGHTLKKRLEGRQRTAWDGSRVRIQHGER